MTRAIPGIAAGTAFTDTGTLRWAAILLYASAALGTRLVAEDSNLFAFFAKDSPDLDLSQTATLSPSCSHIWCRQMQEPTAHSPAGERYVGEGCHEGWPNSKYEFKEKCLATKRSGRIRMRKKGVMKKFNEMRFGGFFQSRFVSWLGYRLGKGYPAMHPTYKEVLRWPMNH